MEMLSYHDYVAVILSMESTRYGAVSNDSERPYEADAAKLDHALQLHREKLASLAGRYEELRYGTIDRALALPGVPGTEKANIPSHLYRGQHHVAFGPVDNLSWFLADDLDLVVRLSGKPHFPVRQTCVCFCPVVRPLAHEVHAATDAFLEPDMLWGKDDEELGELSPLLTLTHFRLNGLALLGSGLLWEKALYGAVCWQIHCELGRLARMSRRSDLLFSTEDVRRTRVCLLDPLGWSDLAVQVFTPNYTVAMSLVSRLRHLRFEHLYSIAARRLGYDLEKVVTETGVNGRVAELCVAQSETQEGETTISPSLPGNHVFCSTYTTCGMPLASLTSTDAIAQAHGIVSTETSFDIPPGHLSLVLSENMEVGTTQQPSDGDGTGQRATIASRMRQVKATFGSRVVWLSAGDKDYTPGALRGENPAHVLSPALLMDQLKALRGINQAGALGEERGVRSVSTALGIPIVPPHSHLSTDVLRRRGHTFIQPLLKRVAETLVPDAGGDFLAIEALESALTQLRVPGEITTLFRTVLSGFAAAIENPTVFDDVLDLFDAYRAVYGLIVHHLVDLQKSRVTQACKEASAEQPERALMLDLAASGFMTEEDMEELLLLGQMLEQALKQRTEGCYRDASEWGKTDDLTRSGLRRVVSAVDAVLRCCCGILRRVQREAFSNDMTSLGGCASSIGIVSKFTPSPFARSRRIRLGNQREHFLSYFDLSLNCLLDPASLLAQFHEIAHYILEIRGNVPCGRSGTCALTQGGRSIRCPRVMRSAGSELPELLAERYEEVACELFVMLLLFPDAPSLYARHLFAAYALSPKSVVYEQEDTLLRFAEFSTRVFLAWDAAVHGESIYDQAAGRGRDVDGAWGRYRAFLQDVGRLYPYTRLFVEEDNEDGSTTLNALFSAAFSHIYPCVCEMLSVTRLEVAGLVADGRRDSPIGAQGPVSQELNKRVADAWHAGRPFSRFEIRRGETVACGGKHPDEERMYVDSSAVVGAVFRQHMGTILADNLGQEDLFPRPDIAFSLRSPTSGEFDSASPLWESGAVASHLVDRVYGGFLSADLAVRGQYMRSRICLVKTLWDLSCVFRARRLATILDMVSEAE